MLKKGVRYTVDFYNLDKYIKNDASHVWFWISEELELFSSNKDFLIEDIKLLSDGRYEVTFCLNSNCFSAIYTTHMFKYFNKVNTTVQEQLEV